MVTTAGYTLMARWWMHAWMSLAPYRVRRTFQEEKATPPQEHPYPSCCVCGLTDNNLYKSLTLDYALNLSEANDLRFNVRSE